MRAALTLALTLLLATSALAGPPLICHPFDIGSARSLPWQGPNWSQIDPNYDLKRLVGDTLALLEPGTPVLVRMETLRRATVYARNDAGLAAQLLARLQARVAVKSKNTPEYALALFDAGYLSETCRQAHWISTNAREEFWKFAQEDPRLDGYSLVARALELRGSDPAMEFAAAVITIDTHKTSHRGHLQRAMAAAPAGSLLERNLAVQFGDEMRERRRAATPSS
jgi:hypothetical protein